MNEVNYAAIRDYILHPRNTALVRKSVELEAEGKGKLSSREKMERNKHDQTMNRLLLKAVFGKKVFGRTRSGAFKALAEQRSNYKMRGNRLREFGRKLFRGYEQLRWAVLSIEPEHLKPHGLTEKNEWLDFSHYIRRRVEYLGAGGEYLRSFGEWPLRNSSKSSK